MRIKTPTEGEQVTKFKVGPSNALWGELDCIASVELEHVLAAWPEFDERQARHLVGYLQQEIGAFGYLSVGKFREAGIEGGGQIRRQARTVIARLNKQGIVVEGGDYENTSTEKEDRKAEALAALEQERASQSLNLHDDGFAALFG